MKVREGIWYVLLPFNVSLSSSYFSLHSSLASVTTEKWGNEERTGMVDKGGKDGRVFPFFSLFFLLFLSHFIPCLPLL